MLPLAVNGSVSSCSKYSTPTIHTQQHHCALRTRLFFLGPFSCSTTFYIRQNWREAFWGKQASDSRFLLAKNNVHQTGCFLVLKIHFSFFSFFAFSDKFSQQKFWIWGRRSPQNPKVCAFDPRCTRLMSVLAAVHRDRAAVRAAVPPHIAPPSIAIATPSHRPLRRRRRCP